MDELESIPGFEDVVRHFGAWPSFHDAVLEQLLFRSDGSVLLSVRTWITLSETDERGYYRQSKHTTVDFRLTKTLGVEIEGTDVWAGTILFGLTLTRESGEYRLRLDPCLGLGGLLKTEALEIGLRSEPTV